MTRDEVLAKFNQMRTDIRRIRAEIDRTYGR